MVRTRMDSGNTPAANPCADEPHVQVLDRHVFEDLLATLGNDTDRVRNVYRKFVDTAVTRLDEVRQQPVTASAATFHALKGSAGMVGANRIASVAARLQEAAPGLTDETKAAALGALETELAAFRRALGTLLDSLSPGQ
jgi:HPt (histidine-containing phosphotransfer) domain-containing protein